MKKTSNERIHIAYVMDNPNPYNPLLSIKTVASLDQQTFCLKDIPLFFSKNSEQVQLPQ